MRPPEPSAPSFLDPSLADAPDAVDPELLELPDPPRKERNLTVAVLVITALASLAMCAALARDAAYAFAPSSSVDLGNLNSAPASAFGENVLVRGEGFVGAAGGIRYERPFEPDSYRLVPLAGRGQGGADLWIEMRVPSGQETGRFVPPSQFEGRLVRFDRAGLRHRGLRGVADAVPDNAWLLVDGETPDRSRWAVTLLALFFGFAVWNVIGISRLLRKVR